MNAIGLWLSIAGCFLGGTYLEGGNIASFFQPSAAVIAWGPILAYLMFTVGPTNSFTLFRRVLSTRVGVEDELVLGRIVTMGYLGGILSFIAGSVHVLQNLADPTHIGAGAAVTFIGMLYGVVPGMILIPIHRRGLMQEQPIRGSVRYMSAAVILVTLTFGSVLIMLTRGH